MVTAGNELPESCIMIRLEIALKPFSSQTSKHSIYFGISDGRVGVP